MATITETRRGRRRALPVLLILAAVAVASSPLARAQEAPPKPEPAAATSPAPTTSPPPVTPAPVTPASPTPASPAPVAPVSTETKAGPGIPDDLARILKRFDSQPEIARIVERAYATTLYFHLARDLDRVVGCFHPDFELHQSTGEIKKVSLEELRSVLQGGYAATPPTKLTLDEMLDFAHIRAYSKEEAHASKDEGWHKEPREISFLMSEDDRLVIAPVRTVAQGDKPTAFDSEVFYVFRRDGNDWKIVLGE